MNNEYRRTPMVIDADRVSIGDDAEYPSPPWLVRVAFEIHQRNRLDEYRHARSAPKGAAASEPPTNDKDDDGGQDV
jgi:hypothetical protein